MLIGKGGDYLILGVEFIVDLHPQRLCISQDYR